MNTQDVAGVSKKKFQKIRAWNRRRNYFIKKAKAAVRVYAAKALWDKHKKTTPDLSTIKTVLLLRNEGALGDVVVDSSLVKSLHDSGYTVDFLLTKANSLVMKHNPYIRNLYEADDVHSTDYLKRFGHNVPDAVIKAMAANRYDLVIDPSLMDVPVHRMRLFRQINPRSVFGFNKWKNLNHYSHSFSFDCVNQHVSKTFTPIADCLGLNRESLQSYDLHLPAGVLEEVRDFNAQHGAAKTVVINIFAGNADRCMSQQQLAEIIAGLQARYADIRIILLDHRREITLTLPEGVMINPFKTLYHVMALIREADLIISPDTSIVHISAAWKKPLVAVYKNIVTNNTLWGPGYDNASQLIVPQGQIHQKKELPAMVLAEIERRGFLQ